MNTLRAFKLLTLLIAFGGGISLYLVHMGAHEGAAGTTVLPVLGTVPDFAFTSQDGRLVSRRDFDGKVWVVNFFFTRCAGICPVMQANTLRVYQAYLHTPGVKLVSLTVDPEHDTADVLRRYAQGHRVSSEKWCFLTGKRSDIYRLAINGFMLGTADVLQDGRHQFIHSEKSVLVDARGRIRGYYRGTDEMEMTRLIGDIRRLLEEEKLTQEQ